MVTKTNKQTKQNTKNVNKKKQKQKQKQKQHQQQQQLNNENWINVIKTIYRIILKAITMCCK